MEREIYHSSTGAKINLYSLLPDNNLKAVIHITHGLAEHALRYSRFASDLVAAGYAVFAHDIRGHGYTKAKDAPQGVFGKSNGFNLALEDQNQINLIKDQTPGELIKQGLLEKIFGGVGKAPLTP